MNKKILNFALTIIVILLVVIFGAIFYMVTERKATNSVYEDMATTITSTVPDNTLEKETQTSNNEVITTDSEEFNQMYPFTGAFPGLDVIPFLTEKENITQFSNEQILRLGFAKVTKEDWADTYVAEDSPVSIPASLLDKYIKDIFGQNVQYKKEKFANNTYSIDKDFKEHTSSYKATYVPETDTYTIEHVAGDGINENYIKLLSPTVSKIRERIEIEIPYVFVVYGDEMVKGQRDGVEGESFEYILYANCDYDTKTFSEELGRFSEFDNLDEYMKNKEDGFVMYDVINGMAKKNMTKVKKLTLVYEQNEEQTQYILKEIKK